MVIVYVSLALLWIFALLIAWGLVALAHQVGLLNSRLGPKGARSTNPGLELGRAVEALEVRDITGTVVRIGSPNDKAQLVVTLSPSCGSCRTLLPGLRSFIRTERQTVDVILAILNADEQEATQYAKNHGLEDSNVVPGAAISDHLAVQGSPYAIRIDPDGTVGAKGIVNHREHLDSLLPDNTQVLSSDEELGVRLPLHTAHHDSSTGQVFT